jgi:hypothetical protein
MGSRVVQGYLVNHKTHREWSMIVKIVVFVADMHTVSVKLYSIENRE